MCIGILICRLPESLHVVAATLEDISEETERERILREILGVPASRRARIRELVRKSQAAPSARIVAKYWP